MLSVFVVACCLVGWSLFVVIGRCCCGLLVFVGVVACCRSIVVRCFCLLLSWVLSFDVACWSLPFVVGCCLFCYLSVSV